MEQLLEGKLALVTGSTRGVGRGVARVLAENGADVIINHVSEGSRELAQELQREIRTLGRQALVMRADISDPTQVGELFKKIRDQRGKLDILVNNAAWVVFRPLKSIQIAEMKKAWEVNILGLISCVKGAAPLMTDGGSIINLSSFGGRMYLPAYGSLGSAKAAVEALTRQLSVELSPAIRVNAVCPGSVDGTAVMEMASDADKEQLVTEIPAGRFVTPMDIGHLVAFLCGGKAEMINGQTIVIDGGVSVK